MDSKPQQRCPADAPVGSSLVPVDKFLNQAWEARHDAVAAEEPLEIRLGFGAANRRTVRPISLTMRMPGNDAELAAGFLVSEGILREPAQIASIKAYDSDAGPAALRNAVRVELAADVAVDLRRLTRHFYTTSSCGVCGKASLEALALVQPPPVQEESPCVAVEAVIALPGRLRELQSVFDRTGGLHAAALFDAAGNILALREDVGRHNAVDKLIGAEFLAGRLPLGERGLLVSGRASFELMQKALMAGIPILAAVGAPSSLAVELAGQFKMTLIGFLRDGRFNVYNGRWRLK